MKQKPGRKAKLEDKTLNEILRLSAYNILRYLRSPDISIKDKAEFSKGMVIKTIPAEITADGNVGHTLIYIGRNKQALIESGEDRVFEPVEDSSHQS